MAPVVVEGDHAQLDGHRRREEPREQAERDADAADQFDEDQEHSQGRPEIIAVAHQHHRLRGRPAQQLAPAVHGQVLADAEPDQRPG